MKKVYCFNKLSDNLCLKKRDCISFLFICLLFNLSYTQCNYGIEIKDSTFNASSGSSLDLFVNGDLVYDDLSTANGVSSEIFNFNVNTNDEISVVWNPGAGDKNSYSILDNTGQTLITKSVENLQPNEVNVICSTCPLPQNIQLEYASDFVSDDVFHLGNGNTSEVRFSFDLPLSQQLNNRTYDWVIMPQGQSPDASTAIQSGTYSRNFYNEIRQEITTSVDKTTYSNFDFYIRTNCEDLSLSQWSQNIPFCVDCGQSDPFKPPYNVNFFYNYNVALGITEGDGGGLGSGPAATGQGNWTTDYFENLGVGSSPDSFKVNMDGSGDVSWIILPEVDLSGSDHIMRLTLGITDHNSYPSQYPPDMGSDDKIYLVYKTNTSGSWIILETYEQTPSGLSFNNSAFNYVDLSSINSTSVSLAVVAFENSNDPENYDFFVDDFSIEEKSCQPAVDNMSVNSVNENSVDISWDASPDESNGYEWYVFNDNENPLFATPLQTGTTSVNQVSIAGLNPQTDYDFYVKTNCDNSQSRFSPVLDFRTRCGIFSAPFSESFEPTSNNEECWTIINADNDNEVWNLDNTLNPNQGVESAQMGGVFDDGDDDWLISPQLNLTGTELLSYEVRSRDDNYPSNLEVLISTTGNSISDFTTVLKANSSIAVSTYTNQTIDLSAYSGPVYIAWYVNNVSDSYGLYLDDISIADCSTETFPYLQDFENEALDIACWNRTNEELVMIDSNCGENTGNFLNIKGGFHTTETNAIDVSTESEVQINFDISNGCNDQAEAGETLNVDYWDGSAWLNVANYDPANLTDKWTPQSFNINSGLTAGFKLRFDRQGGSIYSDDLSIDNLSVDVPQSCIAPTYLSASNITSSSVQIDWAATPSTETGGYEYVLITNGSTPDASTSATGSVASGTTTVNITGLTSNTAYDVYLRAICDTATSDVSEWSSVLSISIPPENDDCSGAIPISVTSDDTQLTSFSTSNASTSPIELNSCDPTANKGVWYTFTAPSPVLEFASGTSNPGITLFEGSSCGNLSEINSSCIDNSSGTISNLTVGNQYYAMIWTDTAKSNADFNLYYKTCLAPLNVTASNVKATSVQLDWNATLSAESGGYEYVLISDGSTPDMNTTPTGSVSTGITTANITGLTFETNYDVYVRAVCDANTSDVSDWSVAISFYTGYCSSVPQSNSGQGVSQVELNGTVLTSGGDITYEDFTGTPIDIQQGVSSDLSITFDSPDSYYTNVWIDLNDNLIFEASELLFTGESVDTDPTLDASFVTPISASLGNHRMRIGTADYGQSTPDPCYNDNDGVTIDMTVNVMPAPSCIAPTNIVASNIRATSVQLGWDASASSETGGYEYVLITDGSTPDASTPATGSVSTGTTSVAITGLTQDTNYDAYVRTVCETGTSTSDWSAVESFFTGYCSSVPSSNDGEGISQVSLNGTTLNSGGDITYEDFTGTSIDIYQGVTSNLLITFNTGYTYDTHVWIDLNDNLIFEASELLFTGESTDSEPTTLDASFMLSASAPVGNHRMRIGTADSGQSTPEPCYEDSYGVTIDMTVNVTPAPSCLAPSNLSVLNITSSSVQLNWDITSSTETGGYEYVLITDGSIPDASTTPTGSVSTGQSLVNITGLSSSTSFDAYVRAVCDPNTSDISDWSAVASFETSPGCGEKFYDNGGSSGNYSNDSLETTTITPDNPGDVVTVTFLSFYTESSYDELTIYDGPDDASPLIGTFDGSSSPGSVTSSHSSGALTFVFESDGSVNEYGWEADVTCSAAVFSPVNDDACDAIALTIDAISPGDAYTLEDATEQNGEPNSNLNGGVDASVWFTFVAPAYGNVQISTDISGGTLLNSEIAVYSVANCNDFTTYNQIGFDQDSGTIVGANGFMSELNLYELNPGETYYIQVDRWSTANSGSFGIEVRDLTYTYSSANAYLPSDPIGQNLNDNVLVVENGTAVIGSATEFHTVIVNSEAVLDLNANLIANVLFKSDASGSGQLANAETHNITGEVTVERFVPAGNNNRRAYRFLSSPVNTTSSINMNWQEGVNNPDSNTNLNPNPRFGTHITGSSSGANGFDTTISGNPSLLLFDNSSQSWNYIDNTNVNTLVAGNAYNLFVRGDRSIDLTNNNTTPTNTRLRATGTLATGNVDLSSNLATGDGEFSFLGNPYQAIVDFNALTFSGDINSNILFIWDPNAGTEGGYEAFDNATPTQQMLQPGQSFFVQNSLTLTTAPGLEFTETAKSLDGLITSVFSESQTAIANLELYNDQDVKLDVMKFRFEEGANNSINDFDAGKLSNPTENLASVNGQTLLSIERRAIPETDEMIPLFINQYQETEYKFKLNTTNWDETIHVYIVDDYLDTETQLTINQTYSFSVNDNIPQSTASNRFSLKIENTTLSLNDNSLFGEYFNLSPNPTYDGLFTITTHGLNGQSVNLKIYNMLGQEIFEKSSTVEPNGEVKVQASKLSSGVYLVKLSFKEDSYLSKLIVN